MLPGVFNEARLQHISSRPPKIVSCANSWSQPQDLRKLIISYAHSILGEIRGPSLFVSKLHRDSVHSWLPIIDPTRLAQAISEYINHRTAETAVLLLHISLFDAQTTAIEAKAGNSSSTLYAICNSVFTLLRKIRGSPIAKLQSGILLAVFEIGEGLLSNAYNTLNICAQLWRESDRNYPASFPQKDEMEILQSAIYLLDRLHYFFSESPRPYLVEKLPSHQALNLLGTDIEPPSAIELSMASLGTKSKYQRRLIHFTQQTQACALLERVALVENPNPSDMLTLDLLLQRKLAENFVLREDDWSLPDFSTVILLLALIELHLKVIMSCPDSRAFSLLAIDTVLNTTRDIARMDDINNIRRMPLAAVLLLRRTIKAASMLNSTPTLDYHPDTGVLEDLAGSLRRARFQWRIAGDFDIS
ncbi:unnamed protein product [Clonostachys solani]|uniref:Transcription factor domain-containing protein n=1 Tax=Clonostachys solani TaxID=160281 RepID=A0A9N9Z1M8_9HYPO|nr:unnamed protein product [Clonostachys solani]